MPMLCIRGNTDHLTGCHLYRILSPCPVAAPASNTDQHLSTAALCMMDVPVVAASRLECHVEYRNLLGGYRSRIALSNEELTVGI